ncbi:MAG: hypothetical protein ACRD1K_15715 [Acidimicrobiales bacterium]
MVATAQPGVVSCTYRYEQNPARRDGAGDGDEGRSTPANPQCEGYRDTGAALAPTSTIRLYVGLRRTICEQALRFGISELLLAVTVQHEGYNRSKLVQGRIDKWIENQFTLPVPFIGSNDTVGVGQMRPDLARRLAREYLDGYDDISEDAIRRLLVYGTSFAVGMAAAYLSESQRDLTLSDRQAFITYAFGEDQIRRLRQSGFEGEDGAPRGRRYDRLAGEILDRGEGFE